MKGLGYAAVAFVLTAGTASASVIWSATSPSSFKGTEQQDCEGNYHSTNGSTVQNVSDPVHGTVIRFHKVSDDRRCEGKGADNFTVTRGQTYYIGWRFKMSSTVNDNSIFQWKSYGSPMNQNYPIVIKVISNQITLQHYQSGTATNLWRGTISANTWYSVVLRVVVADTASGGRIQFWWNGSSSPATLLTGGDTFTGKTFDGSSIEPKWGKYGACGTTIDSYVDDLKIGTTFGDVNLGGGGGGPTPTPQPTATPGPGPTATPAPTATPGGSGFSGYYRITARHSGKAMVVQSASTANSANVFQWTYGGSATNDEWEVRSIGSGFYRIINRNSGKDLTVASASTSEGADIFQYTYGGTATNDEWSIVDVGSGYHRITNRNSGKSAEVTGGGTGDGADIVQRSYSGATHQQFQLVSVP
jgi:hypothetical protein